MTRSLIGVTLLVPAMVIAEPWAFDEPLPVAGDGETPHFHHLDGAGRRHVAVSGNDVGVVWEDDSSGAPQVYIATKPRDQDHFGAPRQISTGAEAYEPAIVGLGDGRFATAWEQDQSVVARIVGAVDAGALQVLAGPGARQITLAGDGDGRLVAVWAHNGGHGQLIEAAGLSIEGAGVRAALQAVAVAPLTEHAYQGYPAAAFNHRGDLLIAWEDRRAGHTRLFHTRRAAGQAFAAERQLNEHHAPPPGEEGAGLGSGVMRVMLAVDGADRARAVWLDKRNAASGYAVWGAASEDAGGTFGTNEIVQDDNGSAVAQWHAALTAGGRMFVAAWDDAREGWDDNSETGDVLLSWNDGGGWSADWLVPVASGAGYQGSPALTLDKRGDLHLVWIERDDLTSPTRLRYAHGRAVTSAVP